MGHVIRIFGFGALVAGLLVAAGVEDAFAQKKNKQQTPQSVSATPADYALMQKNKEVVGTIVSVSGAGGAIVFRVDSPTMEPNPKYKPPKVTNPKAAGYNAQANQQHQMLRLYQDIQRQMQQAARARTPQQQQQAMYRAQMDMARLQMQYQNQYMQQMRNVNKGQNPNQNNPNNSPFQLVHHMKDYEMDLQEGAVLRKTYLPTEFDDMGNIKEYTEKVKAELRGTDKTKPGYVARMDELAAGAEAKLYLVPPKASKKETKPSEEDGVGNVERATIKMVVLTKESPTPGITGSEPKKKGKK